MSTVVTFYSFKGGVGRSMCLANVGVLLARRGVRTLVVDWDLEAPGLERYFEYFDLAPGSGGLLPLLVEAMGSPPLMDVVKYKDHLWTIDVQEGIPLHLLPSGRQEHVSYAEDLDRLDWEQFFSSGGGDLLERLRNQWKADYDVVLIDSRTGLSDSGGICTIQMPDVLVAMFTANEQSILGIRDVIDAVHRGRQRLAYDRTRLTVLPVASRFSSLTEFELGQRWLERFAEVLGHCVDDWVPRGVDPKHVFERLKLPHADWLSFGEHLAVVEQGTSDPVGIGFVYSRIASLLATDFSDVERIVGELPRRAAAKEAVDARARPVHAAHGYEFDLFVSFSGRGVAREWTTDFVRRLGEYVELQGGERVRVFMDAQDVRMGERWEPQLEEALLRSKALLAIVTPHYVTSAWCVREWMAFEAREERSGVSPLIFPVRVIGASEALPDWLWRRQMFDMRDSVDLASTRRPAARENRATMALAALLIDGLRRAPPFNPSWNVAVSDSVLSERTSTRRRFHDRS